MVRTIFAIIGAVVVAGIVLGMCAFCGDDNDDNGHSLGRVELVSYRRGSDCYQYGDCDDNDGNTYRHDYSNHDRNRNRNRDRGAFSPGPFRDSPVVICAPYSCNSGGEQSGGNRENPPEQPPPGEGGQR